MQLGSSATGREVILATNNRHKIVELQQLLADIGVRVRPPIELGVKLEVAEDGLTYAENAVAKALAFARASGLIALADDSGLEVAGLGGEPGVFSARYAGEVATDGDRISLVLERLRARKGADRSARFVCAIAIATPAGDVSTVLGECRGVVTEAPRGENGFGYDPIFYLPERGQTMAELPPFVKNGISHRANAARLARAVLAARVDFWLNA